MNEDPYTRWQREVAKMPLHEVILGAYRTATVYPWYRLDRRADYVLTYVRAWWRHRNLRGLKK